jgi:chaperonin cofactor prefoldin
MSLPRAVQQAEDEANNLINGNTSNETPKDIPEPTQQPDTVETPQAPVQATSDNVDWQAKYQVLQGKYNKEVPTLQDKVKTLESGVSTPNEADSALKTEIEQLRQQLANAQAETAIKTPPTLNEHLVNEYGEEFALAVAESANAQVEALRESANTQVNDLRSEFNQKFSKQEQDISSWSTDAKMSAVKNSLAGLKIDFGLVDNDPLFHDWLNSSDPYSGQTRHSMMMNAFDNGELDRVSHFYSSFVGENQRRSDEHPFSQHVEAPQSSMQDQGTTQPVFDQAAFLDLHKRYQRGQVSDEEFQRKERELYAAMQR